METERTQNILDKYNHQPLFQAALRELLESVTPYLEEQSADAEDYARLERLTMPERFISFKVVWEDDGGNSQVNTGYRIQFNSVLGPYKGGLRFDPSVNEDVLKFLGFEQIFKNSLTGLPLGGGKGGSDFNPKGKSDSEIRRFCESFMTELSRHIGPNTDVPAGDIGVRGREIGYLFGAYKKLQNRTVGVLTGKGMDYGGSCIRSEATGYGTVYFVQNMLERAGTLLEGKKAVISGSGNVATHAAEKLLHETAKPVTLSDRGGYIYAENGFSQDIVDAVKELKASGGALKDMKLTEDVEYREGTPWEVKADLYLPCATQHEIDEKDAEMIVKNGGMLVAEGANMPSTPEAIEVFQKAGVLFGPAKAVNAGGVAVSGLEMSQNAQRVGWTCEDVDTQLRQIMGQIHSMCVKYGEEDGKTNYLKGANIGGFVRVFNAMKQLGW